MVLLEFSMYPLDKGESLSPYVAKSLDIIDQSGLDYRCNSMGTVLEGEYNEVMEVVRKCFEAMSASCNRVECSMRMDFRKGCKGRLTSKIASVEQKLGHSVKQ